MGTPLVTIVIAAYCTDRKHLACAIDSACSQTHDRLEVLIGDDSPGDSLRQIVVDRNDDRLHYVHNVPALGVACNHWSAFKRALGEYIVVLNHDDFLAPEFVATMVTALRQNPEAVLAFCDHWVMDRDGSRQCHDTERASIAWGRASLAAGFHEPFGHLLAAQTIPMAMGAMFRRSALPEELPIHAGPAYDLWLTYLLAKTGGGAWYVPERLSAWRNHDGNLTSAQGLAWLQGAADCWQAVAIDPFFADFRLAAGHKAAGAYGACAIRSWRDRKPLTCARFAWRSCRARLTLRGIGLLLLPLFPLALATSMPRRRSV